MDYVMCLNYNNFVFIHGTRDFLRCRSLFSIVFWIRIFGGRRYIDICRKLRHRWWCECEMMNRNYCVRFVSFPHSTNGWIWTKKLQNNTFKWAWWCWKQRNTNERATKNSAVYILNERRLLLQTEPRMCWWHAMISFRNEYLTWMYLLLFRIAVRTIFAQYGISFTLSPTNRGGSFRKQALKKRLGTRHEKWKLVRVGMGLDRWMCV